MWIAPNPLPLFSDNTSDIPAKNHLLLVLLWALGSIAFLFMKKKTQSPVDLLRVLDIHKGDYGIPTPKSSNRYIPYVSDTYKGKTYIYMEGDTSGDDDKYAFMSDTTDITSSESEYEEMEINDIYVPGSPKYKTLIEVVLEPSKRDIQSDDIPNNDTPTNKFTDNEWNQLKKDFISNMLQNTQNTEPNILRDNVDNNTHPTMSRDNMEEKPFITSIHDRNLYSGEEYNYNINMVNNDDIPINRDNNVYSGIDLINDSLSGGEPIDIYDEVLKRKENELFGTNHVKQTSIHSVAKLTNSDPIHNQLELFHKWLDRHRDIHDDILKIKDETYNIISTNNLYSYENNDITPHQLGLPNIIPSGIIKHQNNGLRTNISMDIPFDEQNNNLENSNITYEDDEVQNS
ncbi:hypothetical protein PFHG_05047 [Plasmodium falciparum HB3]|uniref:Plasmodium falciparum erythrocyte membrane protein 1 acidic terminal segment domain-containing protein n=1 Tax=Plasmodium falciparum (isolate HB3) TaxID=137071 RepID=A0A0L7KKJ0_PLAFX|nr:hypothetical protein PFHG_05047 [Plasmodium falciparum HB3]